MYGAGIAPVILVQPGSQEINLGVSNPTATLSVAPGGTPPFSYQWTFNSVNIPGATGISLTLTNVGVTNLGTYRVVVSNSVSSTTSAPALLSVPVTPSDQAVFAGAPAAFGISLSGGGYSYQWQLNGSNVSGATGATLSLPAATTNQSGNYTVIITFGGNSVTSAPASLEVLQPPANSYAAIVSNDVPVSWWRLGDPPGSFQAADAMGANSGSVYPDVTLGVEGAVLGDSDTAASFTGYSSGQRVGNSRIEVNNNASLNGTVFSAEFWAIASGGAGTLRSPLTSRGTNSGTAGYSFYAGTDDHWQFWLGNGSSTWTVLEGPPVVLDQWAQLAGVYDGTNASFYVNGALVSKTQTVFVANAFNNLRIGAGATESSVGNFFFPGRIDEVAVYGAALTETQIQNHYAAAFPAGSSPRFTLQPSPRAVLAGGNYKFTAIGYGAPLLSYQWLWNGTNLTGATNATLSLTGLSLTNSGTYQTILKLGGNSTTSSPAILTVLNGQAAGVHFKGFENTYTIAADTGLAGYVQTTNWNEIGYQQNSGTASNLVDNNGQTNGMVVTWAANNNHRWSGPIGVPQGDFALFSGFIDDNGTAADATVVISGIPSNYQQAGYSLYVYMGAPSAGSGEVTGTSWYGAVSVGAQTNFYHAVDLALWDGKFLLATNIDPTTILLRPMQTMQYSPG